MMMENVHHSGIGSSSSSGGQQQQHGGGGGGGMETVYGTHEDSHFVMSDRVQSLAGSVYSEFERMIQRYDENVVTELMPLVVNVLECLDLSYTENQEHEVEVELLREDNEQLMTQYEREKQLRKTAEQKFLEIEDAVEEENKELQDKVESLESIVRMLELKSKNSSDHVMRLEEKETDMKKEYNRLHERYTELFKTHMDYMERTKILFGSDRLESLVSSTKPRQGMNFPHGRTGTTAMYSLNSMDASLKSLGSPVDFASMTSPNRSSDSNTSLHSELLQESQSGNVDVDAANNLNTTLANKGGLSTKTIGGVQQADGMSPDATAGEDFNVIGADSPSQFDEMKTVNTSQRRPNTLYQELSFNDPDALGEVDESMDITGNWVHPGEYASSDSDSDLDTENYVESAKVIDVSDNFFGMGKEVENLIMENNELLATKNALNIVKDDLIAKVDELTSEQEILRQEMHSIQAVKSRLQLRVQELEDELRRTKEEAEKNAKANKSDDEDVPMAQRKRFTRVEMARVLMERNQYKERFMELQEAVRWTEMIRASRSDPNLDSKKNRSTVWKFFSNLFSANEKPPRKPMPYVNVRYNAPTHQVAPALDTMRKKNLSDRRKGHDFLDAELSSEKLQQQRARERREQYKQVRAHVRKDDGRMQAYGWSLPATTKGVPTSTSAPSLKTLAVGTTPQPGHAVSEDDQDVGRGVVVVSGAGKTSSQVPVPVPVYCRPLMEKDPGMKIWCAAGVNLTGGRTRDGGSIVGASVFYSDTSVPVECDKNRGEMTELDRLNEELKAQERDRIECEELDQTLSSFVWICTSTHSVSKVTVIDANNPADILESFRVCSSHILCIASVPGAKESDYPINDGISPLTEFKIDDSSVESSSPSAATTAVKDDNVQQDDESKNDDQDESDASKVGGLTFVRCAVGPTSGPASPSNSPIADRRPKQRHGCRESYCESLLDPSLCPHAIDEDCEGVEAAEEEGENGENENGAGDDMPPTSSRRLMKDVNVDVVKDGLAEVSKDNELAFEEVEKMSSVLPTMWLGSQRGSLYVHSAVAQWKRCLHSIKLRDSVLSIVHVKGRVLVALADGTVAIFHRSLDGQWDLTNYHLLDMGRPHHSIRCMVVVQNKVWCGYRNRIHVVEPKTMLVEKSFDAHPRKESQVRQMAWVGDGVWVSIRLDSTLRLYHAHTHHHLQDVDIEPYVSKMLEMESEALMAADPSHCVPMNSLVAGTGKLGFSFVRITALLVSCNRLWMGTGNGVIISVPLSEGSRQTSSASMSSSTGVGGTSASSVRAPGGVIRVYADAKDNVTPGSFIPYCTMAQAQLSFHGHRDAVKFFVAVPGHGGMSAASNPKQSALPIAGRDNYGADLEPLNSDSNGKRPKCMLVVSGGEGYIDFRIGDDEAEDTASHLIMWQLDSRPTAAVAADD